MMLLRHIPIAGFGFNDLKLVILMSMTKNSELQDLLDENPAQTLKELSDSLAVNESTVSRCLHAMGKDPKGGKMATTQID